jgi:hypothetical protein
MTTLRADSISSGLNTMTVGLGRSMKYLDAIKSAIMYGRLRVQKAVHALIHALICRRPAAAAAATGCGLFELRTLRLHFFETGVCF